MHNHTWRDIPRGKTPGTTQIDNRFWRYISSGDTVAEVGSGSGRVIEECIDRQLNVVAIDINQHELAGLKKKYLKNPNVMFLLSDVTKPLSTQDKFNGVIMLGLLGAVSGSDLRLQALKNCINKAVPGCIFNISEFLVDNDDVILAKRYLEGKLKGFESGSFSVMDEQGSSLCVTHNFELQEIKDLVGSCLDIISIEHTVFLSYHGNKRKGVMILARKG
jgi:2-polyprenyl-3-methyl-5-hydroxy-6-metoxy-1,4-benzoquinol methylase